MQDLASPTPTHRTQAACLAAATSTARLHTLTLADLYGWLVVDGRVTHALLDLAGHGQEGLLDVACVLGGGLEKWDAEAVCELLRDISSVFARRSNSCTSDAVTPTHLRNLILHDLLVRHIALVAHQQLVHALSRITVDLLQPLLHVVEAVHVRDIVDDADAVCAAVV